MSRTTWPPADETLRHFSLVTDWGAAKASLRAGREHENIPVQVVCEGDA